METEEKDSIIVWLDEQKEECEGSPVSKELKTWLKERALALDPEIISVKPSPIATLSSFDLDEGDNLVSQLNEIVGVQGAYLKRTGTVPSKNHLK